MLLVAKLIYTKNAKVLKKSLKSWDMGTQLRILREGYSMSTNMTGFRWFLKNLCVLVHWTKVALALEALMSNIPVLPIGITVN